MNIRIKENWSAPMRHGIAPAWKDPTGKELTDRQIIKYQRLGRYGIEAQQAIMPKPRRKPKTKKPTRKELLSIYV
jgi:hypothetical protein